MQDNNTVKSWMENMVQLATVMAVVSVTVQIFSLFTNFTPAAHFVLGIVCAGTLVSYAVYATLKTVYGSGNSGWVLVGMWAFIMTGQFAQAAWH